MARRVTPSPAGLPSRLREQRLLFGLTFGELGALSGKSSMIAQDWEAGALLPDANAVMAWAKIGLDTTYILTGEPSVDVANLEVDEDALPSFIDRLSAMSEWISVTAIGATVLLAVINVGSTLFARTMQ